MMLFPNKLVGREDDVGFVRRARQLTQSRSSKIRRAVDPLQQLNVHSNALDSQRPMKASTHAWTKVIKVSSVTRWVFENPAVAVPKLIFQTTILVPICETVSSR